MTNQRVYQILVYRHEFFKINFTGVPSSSSPVFPCFFPALSLAFFFARAPLSERLEQARLDLLGKLSFAFFFITLSIPDNKLDYDNATISKSREKEKTAIILNSEVLFFVCPGALFVYILLC